MRRSVNPSCGHAEMGFKITTLHYGGEAHYWKRCGLCGKMGEVEIEKSSIFSRRDRSVAPPSTPAPVSAAKQSALSERKARCDAGACLSCGGILCPGSRGDACPASRGVLEGLPEKWV